MIKVPYFVIQLIRKTKGLFFLLKLHYLIPHKIIETISGLAKLSKWISKHKKGLDSDYYTFKWNYDKRYDLYSNIYESEGLDDEVDYIELGVSMGYSFRWWVDKIKNSKAKFYGFDTFTGLPEDWGSFKKGDMSNGNEIPDIKDSRVELFQGLFQQKIPEFLENYSPNKRRIILFDADLFSSTIYGLTALNSIIKKGDILFFDEFNVPLHEFKAFTVWAESYYINYEVLGARNNFYAVAIKIL